MEYNITNVDVSLANKMNTEEGRKIIADLNQKIIEQELMLDQFEISLSHCKEQIDLCTSLISKQNESLKPYITKQRLIDIPPEAQHLIEQLKTEKEQVKSKKLIFEENMLIWKISGYITLISIDVKTMHR